MSRIKRRAGFTLIEVTIAMLIFTMIIVLFGHILIDGLDNYQYLQYQATASQNLSNLLTRVSKVLRGSTQITDAETNTITVYAYFSPQDAVVDKVRYFVSGTALEVGVTPPSGIAPNYTYPSANEVITVLSNNLTTSPSPVFTYYDDSGAQLASGFSLAQIKQVGIFLSVNPSPHYLPRSVSTGTRVTLRNMKTNL